MNKYVHVAYCVPFGIIKITCTKLFHMKNFKGPKICMISPLTEVSLDNGGKLEISEKFKLRDGAKIRACKGAICKIGKNTSVNCNNMMAFLEKIIIGNEVQLGPNMQIYDNDFRVGGGIKSRKYKKGSIKIENNVWIEANTMILRNNKIGDNAVIVAGSIAKGIVPDGTVFVQKNVVRDGR